MMIQLQLLRSKYQNIWPRRQIQTLRRRAARDKNPLLHPWHNFDSWWAERKLASSGLLKSSEQVGDGLSSSLTSDSAALCSDYCSLLKVSSMFLSETSKGLLKLVDRG